MSFVFNDSQQLSLFDKLAFLSPRMKKMLDASWAKAFSDHIFSKIDESIFIPLYSQNSNSRPNAPVNVLVGALMLKEFNGLTDEEITASCCIGGIVEIAAGDGSYIKLLVWCLYGLMTIPVFMRLVGNVKSVPA